MVPARVHGVARSSRVLAATSGVLTSSVLPSFLLGGMAVQVRRDLDFDSWGIGLAFAVFFAVGALASAPAGRLVDRCDPVWVLRGAAAVSAAMSLAIGGLARSLAAVLVFITVAGAANALSHPAANLLILQSLPAHRQGFALAIKQSAIPGAALLAGIAVPALALTVGWRWAFVIGAGLSIVTAAWLPSHVGSNRQRGLAVGGVVNGRAPNGRRRSTPDVPPTTMALLVLAVGFMATGTSSLSSFLVSAAVDSGLGEGAAGLLLTASSIAGIPVRLLIGARADRRGGGHMEVVALLMAGGALAFAGLAVGVPLMYVLAGPGAFCTAWSWQGLFNLAILKANPSRPAAATGITQTGIYLGAVIGPLLFGVVVGQAGYRVAWLVVSAISVVASAALAVACSLLRAQAAPAAGSHPTTLGSRYRTTIFHPLSRKDLSMNDDLLPPRIRELPQMGNHIPAHYLTAAGCDVLFVPCPAGTELPSHSHDTDNLGVILSGEAIVTTGGETRPYGPGEWYATAAGEEHAVRFDVDTVQIELRFEPADGARAR